MLWVRANLTDPMILRSIKINPMMMVITPPAISAPAIGRRESMVKLPPVCMTLNAVTPMVIANAMSGIIIYIRYMTRSLTPSMKREKNDSSSYAGWTPLIIRTV